MVINKNDFIRLFYYYSNDSSNNRTIQLFHSIIPITSRYYYDAYMGHTVYKNEGR